MQIGQIPKLLQTPLVEPGKSEQVNATPGFGEVLNKAIEKLDQARERADEVARQFLAGEIQDLHHVTIAMQEAKLTMQLAVEARNKVIEAYQEISRMQI